MYFSADSRVPLNTDCSPGTTRYKTSLLQRIFRIIVPAYLGLESIVFQVVLVGILLTNVLAYVSLGYYYSKTHLSNCNWWLFNLVFSSTVPNQKTCGRICLALSIILGCLIGSLFPLANKAVLCIFSKKTTIQEFGTIKPSSTAHCRSICYGVVCFVSAMLLSCAAIYISSLLGDIVAILSYMDYGLRRTILCAVFCSIMTSLFLMDTVLVFRSMLRLSGGLEYCRVSPSGFSQSANDCGLCYQSITKGELRLVSPTRNSKCNDHPFHFDCYLSKCGESCQQSCPACKITLNVNVAETQHSLFAKAFFITIVVGEALYKMLKPSTSADAY